MMPPARSLVLAWTALAAVSAPAAPGDPPAAAAPEAFVEFMNGDLLPGTVEGYRTGRETFAERWPPHLLVRVPAEAPAGPATIVRVPVAAVRRVVWKRRRGSPGEAAPGTLRRHDEGRATPFASLRWRNDGVLLLTETGVVRLAFGDVAELHLPRSDAWDAYFATVATLAPGDGERLARCTTTGGLIVTAATAQCRETAGDPKARPPVPPAVIVQPAWAVEPLSIPASAVGSRMEFPPHEVPLTLIPPLTAGRKAVFGSMWAWNIDRNVQGGPLVAGGRRAGWGFGVQASCDLAFPLPAAATAVRAAVALDDAAGAGGCAVARIRFGPPGGPAAWESPRLVGAARPTETGAVPLPDAADETPTLVLSADMADEGTPAGADPHDIRDIVDWFDPVVVLDPEALRGELARRLPATIVAWEGWEAVLSPAATLAVRVRSTPGGFVREVAPRNGTLSLRRAIDVTATTAFLVVGLSRGADGPSRWEVRIDGTVVAAADVPERTGQAALPPFLVPLGRFAGRTVRLEIVHVPAGEDGFVAWHVVDVSGPLASNWEPLQAVAASATGETQLSVLEDGSVLAGGPLPATDEYVVRLRTDRTGITGLRLEGLKHESLARGGPGRPGNNNFVLSGVAAEAVSVADASQTREVRFAAASATPERPGFPAAAILDADPRSGWCNHGQPGVVILSFSEPVGFPGGTDLVIRLAFRYAPWPQHTLGRFRLLATTATHPSFDLPGVLLAEPDAAPPPPDASRP